MSNKLQKDFFLRSTDLVAKELLGCKLVRYIGKTRLTGKIVETEAYMPFDDFANHSAIAQTERNAAMREEGGILYVYKIYGIHHCINFVTEEKGKGCAVLIRAVEPLEGIELMQQNRKTDDIKKLCKGPGNLAKAFAFTTDDNYKKIIDNNKIFILNSTENPDIISDKRIGISRSKELMLRYYIKNCNFVSGKIRKT